MRFLNVLRRNWGCTAIACDRKERELEKLKRRAALVLSRDRLRWEHEIQRVKFNNWKRDRRGANRLLSILPRFFESGRWPRC